MTIQVREQSGSSLKGSEELDVVQTAAKAAHSLVKISPTVSAALTAGRAVVALESTLITHGFPYPENLNTAQRLEATIAENGATPATIAVLGGQITVGLDEKQLEYLATSQNAHKCSRRDLGTVVAFGYDGSTTVAATMIISALAGIKVFCTGGIGGVHRGHPFDISADLEELGRTPVTVVCAGAKSLLDLSLTLEQLETRGVPVIGYGTDELPGFFSRSSGLRVDSRADTPEQVAAIVRARRALGLAGGELVTVPVRAQDELPRAEAEQAISDATREAEERGISGAALTPFVLSRIAALTGGRSQRANMALLFGNARVAAEIALALEVEDKRTA